jgi:hypothetical protein
LLGAEATHQVPLARALRARREHFELSVPRTEEIPFDQLLKFITDLVGVGVGKFLQSVEFTRWCS